MPSLRLSELLNEMRSVHNMLLLEIDRFFYAFVIVDEMVEEGRKFWDKGLVFNLDFEKANNQVNWSFLEIVLGKKNVG